MTRLLSLTYFFSYYLQQDGLLDIYLILLVIIHLIIHFIHIKWPVHLWSLKAFRFDIPPSFNITFSTLPPWWLSGKESSCQILLYLSPAGDMGLIPGLGISPREGNGNPLQYLTWEIPRIEETGGLQPMGLQKSRTRLSDETIRIALPFWHHSVLQAHLSFFIYCSNPSFSQFSKESWFLSLENVIRNNVWAGGVLISFWPVSGERSR